MLPTNNTCFLVPPIPSLQIRSVESNFIRQQNSDKFIRGVREIKHTGASSQGAFLRICSQTKNATNDKGSINYSEKYRVSSKLMLPLVAGISAMVILAGCSQCSLALGVKNGRLQECKALENCISSNSIKLPAKFSPPWSYFTETSDPEKAWKSLINVVESLPEVKIVECTDDYLHAEFPAFPRGIDDVEFYMPREKEFVAYRSASREVIFVYPIQQPVSDLGTNKKRLELIRSQLGWAPLGDLY